MNIYVSLTIVGFKAVGIVCVVWMFVSAAVFTAYVTLALRLLSLFSPIFFSGFVSHLPLIHLLPFSPSLPLFCIGSPNDFTLWKKSPVLH